ncbi:MAG: DMT family transporter [Anaerolineae bacterium]
MRNRRGVETDMENRESRERAVGIYSGLLASFLLGWAPILGKLAYQAGVSSLTLAALRTVVAALFLLVVYLVLWRRMLFIHWRQLLSCLLVGAINGIGSLFYYSALARLDAAQASLLSTLYVVWVVLFLAASGQSMTRLTLLRLLASLIGAILVTSPWSATSASNFLGVMLMLASAAVNGWYLVMGQWVLADVPSGSGTLYILTGMAVTVLLARVGGGEVSEPVSKMGWVIIGVLGLTTALSRLAMFFSLERLGGVQTAILSLMELVVSLALAVFLLGERLSWDQWTGALFLMAGSFLARRDVEGGGMPPPSFNPMDV